MTLFGVFRPVRAKNWGTKPLQRLSRRSFPSYFLPVLVAVSLHSLKRTNKRAMGVSRKNSLPPFGWRPWRASKEKETRMASRVLTLLTIAFVIFACAAAYAQPTIKKVPVSPTSAASGHEMFKTYCSPLSWPGRKRRRTGRDSAQEETSQPDRTFREQWRQVPRAESVRHH